MSTGRIRRFVLAIVVAVVLTGIPVIVADAADVKWSTTTPNPKRHPGASYWIP